MLTRIIRQSVRGKFSTTSNLPQRQNLQPLVATQPQPAYVPRIIIVELPERRKISSTTACSAPPPPPPPGKPNNNSDKDIIRAIKLRQLHDIEKRHAEEKAKNAKPNPEEFLRTEYYKGFAQGKYDLKYFKAAAEKKN